MVAYKSHNLMVAGSTPAAATKVCFITENNILDSSLFNFINKSISDLSAVKASFSSVFLIAQLLLY